MRMLKVFLVGLSLIWVTACDCKKTNEAPTVTIDGEENQTVEVNETLELNATASDSDGNITAYRWTEGNTTLSTASSLEYNATREGNYTITVTVTDDVGKTASDSVNITVTEATNDAPIAKISASSTSVIVDDSVTLDGSGSTDDSGIDSYAWSDGNRTFGTTAEVTYTPTTSGNHTITLTVTDDDNVSDNATITISATVAENNAPVAKIAGKATKAVDVNDSIELTSASTDSDGSITEYRWTEGNTTLSTAEFFDYNDTVTEGNHTITLRVTDNDGATDEDTVVVTVETP
jgi:PKD repeat protein